MGFYEKCLTKDCSLLLGQLAGYCLLVYTIDRANFTKIPDRKRQRYISECLCSKSNANTRLSFDDVAS